MDLTTRLEFLLLTGAAFLIGLGLWALHDKMQASDIVLIGFIYLCMVIGQRTAASARARATDARTRYRNQTALYWVAVTCSFAIYWIFMRYANETQQFWAVYSSFGTLAYTTIGTVRERSSEKFDFWNWTVPLFIPVGTIFWYAVHGGALAMPIFIFTPATAAVMLMLRSLLQRANDEAWDARRAAELARDQAQTERDARLRFLASASHDLGQPLQSARLYLDQALRAKEDRPRRVASAGARDALAAMADQLHQMIAHLKLESGVVEPRTLHISLSVVLARAVARFEPAAANKAIELRPQPSRLRVCSDPELTERAVSNLIDNAIRHAQCTKIVIGALRRGKTVRLYVIDNGVGIFRRDRATLFDDYAQGSDHGDVIRGGFGLGLASARRAMELMGGKVEFDERWTSGSAFFLEFR